MKKNALVAMAALAVMMYSVSAFAAAGTCQDWKGAWEFTYDNATITRVCFDNTSIDNETFAFCDNATDNNCECITDNNSKKLLCIDNDTFDTCAADNITNCVCVDNPLYGHSKGKKAVSIDNATDNVTFFGKKVPCYATGKKGTTPVTIVQADNATAVKLGIVNKTYFVYEGDISKFDNLTFAQILPANFKKGADNTTFTAEKTLNFLSLASGFKSDNETPPTPVEECELKIIPSKIHKLISIVNPIIVFVITAPKATGVEFARPVKVTFSTEAITSPIALKITKRLILGLMIKRPFKLESDNYTADVTYGDNGTGCAPFTVK